MCCQGMRILVLFALTALSFVANYFYENIAVILWYALFVNIFTCAIFFIDGVKIRNDKKPLPLSNLFYFSIVGGVFGGILATILMLFPRKSKRKSKWFLAGLVLLLVAWVGILFYMYKNYLPFQELFL